MEETIGGVPATAADAVEEEGVTEDSVGPAATLPIAATDEEVGTETEDAAAAEEPVATEKDAGLAAVTPPAALEDVVSCATRDAPNVRPQLRRRAPRPRPPRASRLLPTRPWHLRRRRRRPKARRWRRTLLDDLVRDLRKLKPPPVVAADQRQQVQTYANIAASSRSLAAALRARSDVAERLRALERAVVSGSTLQAQRARAASVEAFNRRVAHVAVLAVRAQRERLRIQRELG